MASSPRSWAARAAAAVAIAHQIAAKALRDSIFLSQFPVEKLPQVVVLSAGVSIVVVLLATRLLARLGPARLVPLVFLFDAVVFVMAWLALPSFPQEVAVGIYFAVSALGALLVSSFWSAFNESFDPHAAKAEVARVGASATFGGVLGGVLAERASSLGGPRAALLVLVGLALLGAFLVRRFSRQSPGTLTGRGAQLSDPRASEGAAEAQILRSPLLIRVAALVTLLAVTSTLLDFTLKAEAQVQFLTEQDLVRFFAAFYAVVSVATFAVQSLASPRLLQRAGLGGTLVLLPAGVLLSAGLAASVLRVWSAAVSKGVEAVLTNSTHRSAYELLFTPLSRARKRATKLIIDVLLQRFGDALGAGIVFGVSLLVVTPGTYLLWLVVGLSGVTILLIRAVHRKYVAELVDSLQRNLLKLEATDGLDATTRRAIETTVSLNRRGLLREIERQRRADQRSDPAPAQEGGGELSRALHACVTRDPGLPDLLRRSEPDRRLAPVVIELLADPAFEASAAQYLTRAGRLATGALGDALADPLAPLPRQLRIVDLLAETRALPAVAHLWSALGSAPATLRLHIAATLVRWKHEPGLPIQLPRVEVLAQVERELALEDWLPDALDPLLERGEHPLLGAQHRAPSLRVLQAFTLLGLVFEAEPLSLALRGLFSGDARLRGTALEYLENTVPRAVERRILAALKPGG